MPGELTEADWERYALEWMGEWGWSYLPGASIAPKSTSDRLERESWDDLVLVDRLREAIVRINPGLPPAQVEEAMGWVRHRESSDPLEENFRVHQVLTRGRSVSFTDVDGAERNPTVRLLDFHDPYANDLLVTNQVIFRLGEQRARFDIVAYVNGLPLAIFELKKADDKDALGVTAYQQLRTYLHHYGVSAFSIPAVAVASDGITAKVGTPFSPWEHFSRWNVDEWGSPTGYGDGAALEVLITGVFEPGRFFDLLENFIEFSTGDSGAIAKKKVAKAHQYFAVNKAIDATLRAVESDGRAGVVWHTQGSGKSLEMLFYANKLMRHKKLANPTIVLLTDRIELDGQLFQDFTASRLRPERPTQLTSRPALRTEFNRGGGGIIFSTVHKFGRSKKDKEAGTDHPVLSHRKNIIVIADEAHRSHYQFEEGYARRIREALPNATFIAFTGTPVSTAERNTRAVFGDYIDIYDLSRSVEDGATVKVFYENRHVPVTLPEMVDPDYLDERADDAIAELPEEQRSKVQHAIRMVEQVIGAPERLAEVAEDLIAHWERRREEMRKQIGVSGKGMVVCLNRRICADLYAEIVRRRPEWAHDADDKGLIKALYSGKVADKEPVSYHVRSDSRNTAIQRRASDPEDDLELILVASKLLTGFDSPPLHTMYLDKPMKDSALMQAISRVNRTFGGKEAGLVVDYIGVTERLTEALAKYTRTDQDDRPIGKDISEAVDVVHEQHAVICDILSGYDWRGVLFSGRPSARLDATLGVVEYLRDPVHADNLRGQGEPDLADRFGKAARVLKHAFALCAMQEEVWPHRDDIAFFDSVRLWMAKFDAEEREAHGQPNPPEIEFALRQLAASSVAAGDVVDVFAAAGIERPDLTHLDEGFIDRMRASARPNLAIEALRRQLERQIRKTHRHNLVMQRSFSDRLLEAMRKYTNSSLTAAEIITELVQMAKELNADKERARDLGLDEDELAFYDAVSANESAVRELGTDVLARIAHDLVTSIKKDVSVDWAIREQVQAKLRSKVKRLLAKYGYPPDAERGAIELVLEQTRTYAEDWTS